MPGRELSSDFKKDLLSGKLCDMLDAVKRDDTLCMEIRKSFVNIYYRGGSLCKITEGQPNTYSFYIDPNYSSGSSDVSLINKLNQSKDCGFWVENIPFIKSVIDRSTKISTEREFQQLVLRENNSVKIGNGTDYYIIDIEYDEKLNNSRFDMVAAKWFSNSTKRKKKKEIPLSIIEMKYGDGALRSGNSGVLEHFQDMVRFINDPVRLEEWCEEMRQVFNQKTELGLILGKQGEIESISKERPELIFIFANHDPDSKILLDEMQKLFDSTEYKQWCEQGDIRIAVVSAMGYGLYDPYLLSLPEYIELLKRTKR